MKKYSQLHKIIVVLMSFILLIEFTGCYSARIISTSEITASDKYLIRYNNLTYSVNNVVISDGMLSGKTDFTKKKHGDSDKTHIYLSSDSAFKIDDNLISLPVASIAKIEKKIPDPRKTKTLITVLIIAGCVGTTVGLIAMISDLLNIGKDSNNSTGVCTNW